MANFNKVLLMGNLTRDVELRTTQGGTAIAKFGMAINRKFKQQSGEMKEETCFVDLTAWGRQAEVIAQYTQKGSPLFVEGRLEYSTWEAEGGKRSKLAVVVENFQLMGGRGSGASGGGGQSAARAQPAEEPVDYGDIPF
jgi:single-strand DNA-binding protein